MFDMTIQPSKPSLVENLQHALVVAGVLASPYRCVTLNHLSHRGDGHPAWSWAMARRGLIGFNEVVPYI
jgi:hypothetical protein